VGLGWYVMRIDAIDKRPARTLDQARGRLSPRCRTADALADLTAAVEELDKGESLTDVARLKLELTSTALAYGRRPGLRQAGRDRPAMLGRVLQVA
jgi:peptidyl-prolyl cis-trans isomerase D